MLIDNGVLSGLGLDGKHFFYMNPLSSHGGYAREQWCRVACCPPNLMRLLGSLAKYFVTHNETGIQVHLYNTASINAELDSGQRVRLSTQTDYSWQGVLSLTVEEANGSAWQLRLHMPDWCPNATVRINGNPVQQPTIESSYIVLERAWQPGDIIELTLPMEAILIEAHPRIDATRDSIAIQRGPLVYCLEEIDHPNVNLPDIQLESSTLLQPVWREDLVSAGLMAIQSFGSIVEDKEWHGQLYRRLRNQDGQAHKSVPLTAIPYYAWANRGANAMRVWIHRATLG